MDPHERTGKERSKSRQGCREKKSEARIAPKAASKVAEASEPIGDAAEPESPEDEYAAYSPDAIPEDFSLDSETEEIER